MRLLCVLSLAGWIVLGINNQKLKGGNNSQEINDLFKLQSKDGFNPFARFIRWKSLSKSETINFFNGQSQDQ